MEAGKYYALLRFEEAAVALRAALSLNLVDEIGEQILELPEFQRTFGFTSQGTRIFVAMLEVMEVLQRDGGSVRVAERARETLGEVSPGSRRPYLMMGAGDQHEQLIAMLRGDFPEGTLPLYGGEETNETLMDQPDAGREIAYGLASRAKNFAEPLVEAIKPYANKAKIIADVGAGSPYFALECARKFPFLSKVVLIDRANSMQYAREMVREEDRNGGAAGKLEYVECDFFQHVPPADVFCLSNTAHDWLPEEYALIMARVRESLSPGGTVCIHEPLLLSSWNSAEQWVRALWMACYALTLFKLCKGKGACYTREEHNATMHDCGFVPVSEPVETQDGCTALFYHRLGDQPPESPSQQVQTHSLPATA